MARLDAWPTAEQTLAVTFDNRRPERQIQQDERTECVSLAHHGLRWDEHGIATARELVRGRMAKLADEGWRVLRGPEDSAVLRPGRSLRGPIVASAILHMRRPCPTAGTRADDAADGAASLAAGDRRRVAAWAGKLDAAAAYVEKLKAPLRPEERFLKHAAAALAHLEAALADVDGPGGWDEVAAHDLRTGAYATLLHLATPARRVREAAERMDTTLTISLRQAHRALIAACAALLHDLTPGTVAAGRTRLVEAQQKLVFAAANVAAPQPEVADRRRGLSLATRWRALRRMFAPVERRPIPVS